MLLQPALILPMVIVFCVIGAFALNNRPFDIWVMLAFGCSASLLEFAKVPLAPFVVGLVLAPLAEAELRAGLMASAGSYMPLVQRPMAGTMLAIAAALFVWPFAREWRRRPRAAPATGPQTHGRITMNTITQTRGPRSPGAPARCRSAGPHGARAAGVSRQAGPHDHPDRARRPDRRRRPAPAAHHRQEQAAAAADRRRQQRGGRRHRRHPADQGRRCRRLHHRHVPHGPDDGAGGRASSTTTTAPSS